MDLVRKMPGVFDLEKAQKSLQDIIKQYPFTPQRRQISLTCRSTETSSIEDGIGSLYDFNTRTWLARESDFRYFNSTFRDSYFFEIYQLLQERTENQIGRVRLMNLAPKACYSMHQDPTPRLHLVLQTNPQSFLIFANAQIVSLPADGSVYFVDTRHMHSAMNGGHEERIHLVCSVCEGAQ